MKTFLCGVFSLSITKVSSFISSPALIHHQSDKLGQKLELNAKQPLFDDKPNDNFQKSVLSSVAKCSLLLSILATTTLSSTVTFAEESKSYDGFADYAKENQMSQSDVSCFVNKCLPQTKALFANPRGIKGISCLGRCKGEQSCATRCFAEYGSESLNSWLSCTIEENECVKVPKNLDNSAEDVGYSTVVSKFDPNLLIGKWYKTDGLNPNYDLFDCQTNVFKYAQDNKAIDMDIFFRVRNPDVNNGYWENALTETMVVDGPSSTRTMHTQGQMYGLNFNENWYIIGQSDGKGDIPPFVLVAYKGHTLQGNYEGSFVYAKEPILPKAAIPAVMDAASKAGLDFNSFTRIDNTCPMDAKPLNDSAAGTGTSTTDWINLVVGEGGVIDWIFPGWRGEYKNKA